MENQSKILTTSNTVQLDSFLKSNDYPQNNNDDFEKSFIQVSDDFFRSLTELKTELQKIDDFVKEAFNARQMISNPDFSSIEIEPDFESFDENESQSNSWLSADNLSIDENDIEPNFSTSQEPTEEIDETIISFTE